MPSVRSRVFRGLVRIGSAGMKPTAPVSRLRLRAGGGLKKPLLPRGATLQRTVADGVPVEWVVPPGASSEGVILYLHGGGWVLGLYNSSRWMISHICQAAGCRALAVDYRLAPEHPFPAALEDCIACYRWLLDAGHPSDRIVFAGDSAGGNLVLATMMALRDEGEPLPAAGVCISPMTDLACTGESFRAARDPAITAEFAEWLARQYVSDNDPTGALISPHYSDLSGLPRLLVQVGGDEILRSDSERLVDRARAASVAVDVAVFPGMWHLWHVFAPYLPEAQQAVEEIGAFVRGTCVGAGGVPREHH